MPIKKSAKKALKQSKVHNNRNQRIKETINIEIKKFESQLGNKKTEDAKKTLPKVESLLDKAWKKHIMKKNTVSRKKSRLRQALNKVTSKSKESKK